MLVVTEAGNCLDDLSYIPAALVMGKTRTGDVDPVAPLFFVMKSNFGRKQGDGYDRTRLGKLQRKEKSRLMRLVSHICLILQNSTGNTSPDLSCSLVKYWWRFKANLTSLFQTSFLWKNVTDRRPYPDDENLVEVKFARTPVMSTYLVAFVVGEYDFVETRSTDGVLVRVYTPVGKAEQGKFALEVKHASISFSNFDSYLKINIHQCPCFWLWKYFNIIWTFLLQLLSCHSCVKMEKI